MMHPKTFTIFAPPPKESTGPTAAIPSADRKSAVVSRTSFEEDAERNNLKHQTARWLTNLLGRDFPVEKVYPGHIENYLVWVRSHGR